MLPGTKPRTTRRSPSHCATTPSLRSWPLRRRRRQIRRRSEFVSPSRFQELPTALIEISPAGGGVWHTLPTQIDGSRLVARVDDAALPAGVYVLRARARDLAGNEASTDRKDDGQPMVITLPLRRCNDIARGVRAPGPPSRKAAAGDRTAARGEHRLRRACEIQRPPDHGRRPRRRGSSCASSEPNRNRTRAARRSPYD